MADRTIVQVTCASSLILISIMLLMMNVASSIARAQPFNSSAADLEHEGEGAIGRDVARMLAELTAAGSSSSSSGLNAIDACWRSDRGWASNRKRLADCAIGFGGGTTGGKAGNYYAVTDAGDDATDPAPGTLRYGAIQEAPLWIYFARSMTIVLANELIITSDKTIDGRGARVEIAYGPCLTIQGVSNVIVHGLSIHHCKPGKPGRVRSSVSHVGFRRGSDGDAVSVLASRNVWIDHNAFAACDDGLVDVIRASTAVTISNNYFAYHDKVMLLGASDAFAADKNMRVSIVFNHFGPGLVKRMPRCRFGVVHIAHNNYDGWKEYAIGGSLHPTIISVGNRFNAPSTRNKEVTKRERTKRWKSWVWKSVDDTFLNGAFFRQSGPNVDVRTYGLGAASQFAPYMTSSAGPLTCPAKSACY